MNRAETLRTLRAIDWDFALPRAGYVPPPHWYPGTFVPALSDALIEALTSAGGTVFDPYSGIGTTGWSAIRTGRSCHLADVNPVGLLVGYAATSLLALARQDRLKAKAALGGLGRVVGKHDDLFVAGDSAPTEPVDRVLSSVSDPTPLNVLNQVVVGAPQWDALGIWLHEETLRTVQAFLMSLNSHPSSYVRVLGLSMLSAVVRSVSSQHASWGHIADNVKPKNLKPQNVDMAFSRWLRRTSSFIDQRMLGLAACSSRVVKSHVHRIDWSKTATEGNASCDLLLTSPPYADAIDYTLAQRLSLYLLGYTQEQISGLVNAEIGARRKRSKPNSRGTWAQQLCDALQHQLTWLKPAGVVCLVLPHKDAGRSAGEEELKSSLVSIGWELMFERDRSIHQSHTRQSWTSIKRETILVFSPPAV
jgi:hypothetical protein